MSSKSAIVYTMYLHFYPQDTEPGEDNVKKDVLDRFLAKAEPVDDCTCRTDMPPNTDSFVMCPNKGYFCRVKRGSLPWLAETWREVAGVMGDAENGQVPSGEEGWTTADKSKPVRKLSGLVRAESLPAMSLSNQAGGTEEDSNYHRAGGWSWWRHQMGALSALPVIGEFPAQRPVTRSFDVFFDIHLDKRFG